MRRHPAAMLIVVLAIAAGLAGSTIPTGAQSKPVPGFADYGKWETLAGGGGGRGGGGGGLSNDGKWLAYSINKSNRDTELRLLNLATNALTTEKFGSGAVFNEDSNVGGVVDWILRGRTGADAHPAASRPEPARGHEPRHR